MPNNSKTVQDRAMVTMADQQKVIYGLSNGTIFNDLVCNLAYISRSMHYYWCPRHIVCTADMQSVCDS